MLELESLWSAAGAAMYPLSHLNDAALFFIGAAAIAVGTPDRACRVARALGARLQPYLETLLHRADTSPRIVELLSSLPARDGMSLITERTTCVVCNEPPEDGRDGRTDRPINLPIYSSHGLKRGAVFLK